MTRFEKIDSCGSDVNVNISHNQGLVSASVRKDLSQMRKG
jgi:hypothetical protein